MIVDVVQEHKLLFPFRHRNGETLHTKNVQFAQRETWVGSGGSNVPGKQ